MSGPTSRPGVPRRLLNTSPCRAGHRGCERPKRGLWRATRCPRVIRPTVHHDTAGCPLGLRQGIWGPARHRHGHDHVSSVLRETVPRGWPSPFRVTVSRAWLAGDLRVHQLVEADAGRAPGQGPAEVNGVQGQAGPVFQVPPAGPVSVSRNSLPWRSAHSATTYATITPSWSAVRCKGVPWRGRCRDGASMGHASG
jgi:hypothetical protein